MQPLASAVRYEARSFPIGVRITLPAGEWAGAQWTTRSSHGQPAFGWLAIGQLPLNNPRGLLTMETAFGPTPSAPTILGRLRSGRAEAVFEKTRRVALAGFPGWLVEGRVVGSSGHGFVPFTPGSGGERAPGAFMVGSGERFRVIVLDVRGKSVVLFLESLKLRPQAFHAFTTMADRIVADSLEFPG